MNERIPSDPELGGSSELPKPPPVGRMSASRRHFAKAGVAAPVVLGSLLSKPALGAGYTCTISGQMSGNTSSHPTANTCSELGSTPALWVANAWPTASGAPAKGNNPATAPSFCKWNGALVKGSTFSGYSNGGSTLGGYFFFNPGTACSNTLASVAGGSSTEAATMLQVLNATVVSGDVFDLGREIVAAILSSLNAPNTYPVRVPMLIDMFNKVAPAGGTYQFPNSTKTWTRAQVLTYLKSLHP
jgi:hypothetical protein